MKVSDFYRFGAQLNDMCHIDLEELTLISYIAGKWEKKEEVTITSILESYTMASPATTHKRLSNLINNGVLAKTLDDKDLRVKTLSKGETYNDLVKFLKGV